MYSDGKQFCSIIEPLAVQLPTAVCFLAVLSSFRFLSISNLTQKIMKMP